MGPPVVLFARARRKCVSKGLARSIEPALLALESGKNLPLPTLSIRWILTGEMWTAIRLSNRGLSRACT